MTDRGRMQKQSGHGTYQLKVRLEALADRSRATRKACASTCERAAEIQRTAARIRARSLALRGAVLRVMVPRAPTCGAIARRQLEAYLDGHSDDVVSDLKTVASELVNNAYRHGEGAIELRVKRYKRYVRVEVGDEGPTGAVRVKRGRGRRGLAIVDALSLRWGAFAGSTHVWADLPIGPEASGLDSARLSREVDR